MSVFLFFSFFGCLVKWKNIFYKETTLSHVTIFKKVFNLEKFENWLAKSQFR